MIADGGRFRPSSGYTPPDASRRRRRSPFQRPASRPTTASWRCARPNSPRAIRARPVRHDPHERLRHAAAAAAVLGLRPLRDGSGALGRLLDLQQARRRRQRACSTRRRRATRLSCLGPLGRPFSGAAAGREAWMVAGGVGLAPFATLSEDARCRRGVADDALLRRATGGAAVLPRSVRTARRAAWCSRPRTASRGARGRVTVPLAGGVRRALAAGARVDGLCVRPGGDAGGGRRGWRRSYGQPSRTRDGAADGLRHGRLLQLRACACARRTAVRATRDPASKARSSTASDIVWDWP